MTNYFREEFYSVKLDMPSPSSRDAQEHQEDKSRRIPGEPLKTLLAAIFLGTGFLATTFSLAFTHERVPETEPLPDLFLDTFNHQDWGLNVSEIGEHLPGCLHHHASLPGAHHVRYSQNTLRIVGHVIDTEGAGM